MGNNYRSSSGEGNAFENRFGAYALAHLLAERGMAALRNAVPKMISFQAWDQSKVDDFVIHAEHGDGRKVKALIASRIHPRLIPSDAESRLLFSSFLSEYTKSSSTMIDGSSQLVLVAESACRDAQQLHKLTSIARNHAKASLFGDGIASWNAEIRERHRYFSELIAIASKDIPNSPDVWSLLKALTVDLHQWTLPSTGALSAKEALDTFASSHAKGRRLDFDHLVTVSADLSHHGGTVDKTALVQRLIADGLISGEAQSSTATADVQATLSGHIANLYRASRLITDRNISTSKVDEIYRLMKEKNLRTILTNIPDNVSALETSARILGHHAWTRTLSDCAKTLAAESSKLRNQLIDLEHDYAVYDEDRKWRHSYDLNSYEAEMVISRGQDLEVDQRTTGETLDRLRKSALAMRDEIEFHHPTDAVL